MDQPAPASAGNAGPPNGKEHDVQPLITDIGTDPDALERFYREHIEAVQRFVARRVSDPHLAADLTADVFLAAVDAAARYEPDRGSPRAWLFGIARNVLAMHVRRSVRERNAVRRMHGHRDLGPDAIQRILERIDAERDARELIAAVAELDEAQRAVVELVAVDGLTPSEAASVLGVTAVVVRVRLHRARRRLAAMRPTRTPDEVTS